MKYQFPLAIPEGERLYITQGYKDTALVDFYRENGINWTVHRGLDVTRESLVKTYGTPFVCPFTYATFDRVSIDPATNEPRFIQINSTLPNGDKVTIGCDHLSKVEVRDVYSRGDVVGYLGNYGLVSPAPSNSDIANFSNFAGTHAHIECMVNGVFVNPLDYFDIGNPFRAPDTGFEGDLPSIARSWRWILEAAKKLGL